MRNVKSKEDLGNYKTLFMFENGLVMIQDGSTGMFHSVHPNIDSTGSVSGMKKLGYWGKGDVTLRAGGFIHNISRIAYSNDDPLDMIAYEKCMCPTCAARNGKQS